jgi:hypothetical protein
MAKPYSFLRMPTPLKSGHNLHSLYMHDMHPLGVVCKACCRKVLVEAGKIGAEKGRMKELRTLRFVCSACGSRDWRGWLFVSAFDAACFLEGQEVRSIVDGSRPTF